MRSLLLKVIGKLRSKEQIWRLLQNWLCSATLGATSCSKTVLSGTVGRSFAVFLMILIKPLLFSLVYRIQRNMALASHCCMETRWGVTMTGSLTAAALHLIRRVIS